MSKNVNRLLNCTYAKMFMNLIGADDRKTRVYKQRFKGLEEWNDGELYDRFRFDRDGILYITDVIRSDLDSKNNRGLPLSPEHQVMATLRYLASNDLQIGVGDDFGISQQAISTSVAKVLDALLRHKDEFIQFPLLEDERKRNQHEFYKLSGK